MDFQLQIKRNGGVIGVVEIDENTIYSGEFMGMDKITSSFTVSSPLDLRINDYIEHNGRTYKIKTAVPQDDIDAVTHRYDLTFYGRIYDLYNAQIKHLKRTKFSYTGTPLELLGLLITSINERNPGWSIGDCSDISEPETFDFEMQSCRAALATIAERFKLEYYIDDQDKIYLLEKVGKDQNITMKAGRGQGLYTAARKAVDQDYATVWYFYGGTQNLPEGYRDGMDRIALADPYLINTDKYGEKEGSVIFEDAFPRRTSTITAVNGLNEVTDSTIDFNLNAQSISEGNAKIVFKSGELSGQEFVITYYNDATKTIRFGSNKDESGYVQPNATFSAAVGDKYTLIGIVMPQSYVDAAEAEVMALGEAHAKKNSFPPVAFPLNIDEKFIRDMGYTFKLIPGDTIHVQSDSLGVDTRLRLQSVSYPLVNPSKIEGIVSDVIQYNDKELMVKDIKQNKKETSKGQKTALYARQIADEVKNAAILQEFKQTYIGERAVLTGAFVAGNPDSGEVAGINGGDDDPQSTRIWAGSSFEDKDEAPFRVLQNGQMFATDAFIEGVINALSGKIAGFLIGEEGLTNDNNNAFVALKKAVGSGEIGASLGVGIPVDYWNWGEANAVMSLVNTAISSTPNLGIQIDVAGGAGNYALDILRGFIFLRAGCNFLLQESEGSVLRPGLDYEADVRIGGDTFVHMKWIKGILVSAVGPG